MARNKAAMEDNTGPLPASLSAVTRGLAKFMLALRFARREMRGGFSGFFIFLACIMLGVAAIGGVNSVARAISHSVESQGQELLGADLRFEIDQREASDAERAWLDSLGTLAESVNMRSMARLADGSDQALVEVKAVDGLYPLYGELVVEPPVVLQTLLANVDGVYGVVAPAVFFDRLGLSLGDRFLLGSQIFELRGELIHEPDMVSEGLGFAPRLMVSLEGLAASGLVQPGSLVEFVYKIRLDGPSGDDRIGALRDEASERFPDAGWSIRTRLNAAPALSSNIERFSQFLTLVGLTALVVGGVGVANAVRTYLEGKRAVIATFKSLGASGGFVVLVYLLQIGIIALVGIAFGLVLAALMPFAAQTTLSSLLPIDRQAGLYPDALGMAVLFGSLTTLAFALLPLGRARDVPATALFREMGFEGSGWPPLFYLAAAGGIAILLVGIAIYSADDKRIAAIFVTAAIAAFLVLRGVAALVQALARRTPPVRSTALRLAIGNIHRPGALTPSVVLSLGLGLTLLSTLAMIDGNLRQQITENLPDRAPSFFFVDIQPHELENFVELLGAEAPGGELLRVPMLRGRITHLNGQDTREIDVPPEGAWVLRGDRGITYSETPPENATLTEGEWWPENYDGQPLVSFTAQEARELGLTLGDSITVNVLGRSITARIASLRQVEWETLAMNFVMVFSPNTFSGAPHAWLATLSIPEATSAHESRILNAVTHDFPTVTTLRVKDALEVVNNLLGQIGTAIRASGSVTLLASVLVLSGALAAGNRARMHDAVVLKTLGATRRILITAFTLEFLLIGLATALFAFAAGAVSSWFVVARVMNLPWSLLGEVGAITIFLALGLTVGLGLLGTWRLLGQRAAPVLRNL